MEKMYANVSAETVKVLHDPNIETQDVTSSGMAGRQQFGKIKKQHIHLSQPAKLYHSKL